MELKFKYSSRDVLACSLYLTIRILVRYWFIPVIALVVMGVEGLILFGGFLIQCFLLTLFLMGKRNSNAETQMKIKDGILTITNAKVYVRYYCDEFVRVKKTRKYIYLNLKTRGMETAAIVIPASARDIKMERKEFLDFFERQKDYARQLDKTAWTDSRNSAEPAPEAISIEDADFSMEVLWSREMVEAVKLQNMQIQYMKEFSGRMRHRVLAGTAIIWLLMILIQILLKKEQIFSTVYSGIVLIIVIAIIFSGSKNPPAAKKVGKMVNTFLVKTSGIAKEAVLSQILVSERGICIREAKRELAAKWETMKYLMELNGWLLIYGPDRQLLLNLPKAALNGVEEQERFIKYCGSHGVEYRLLKEEKSLGVFKYAAACAVVLVTTFMMIFIEAAVAPAVHGITGQFTEQSAEQTTEYVFRPEDFEAYLPLEKQVGVLKSLELRIPQSLVEEERAWMEEHPRAHEWVEARPYYMLLSDLGFPEYDEETYEVTSYSS